MSYLSGLAVRIDIPSAAIEKFISTGEAAPGIASALGTGPVQVTDFVQGRATGGIAATIGLTVVEAQQLRDALGREGAIGLLLGVACGRARVE